MHRGLSSIHSSGSSPLSLPTPPPGHEMTLIASFLHESWSQVDHQESTSSSPLLTPTRTLHTYCGTPSDFRRAPWPAAGTPKLLALSPSVGMQDWLLTPWFQSK